MSSAATPRSVLPQTPPAIYRATMAASFTEADGIALALEAEDAPPALAVTLFESGPARVELSAYYASAPSREELIALIRNATGVSDLGKLRIEALADRDWVKQAEGLRGPVRAGRFLLHGSHDRASVPHSRCRIEIDAGMAFGTAHHASTRGSLLALDRLLKRWRPKAVLDVGTGTGILAIAAARSLPPSCRIIASDIDPRSVATALANAKANGVRPRLSVVKASGLAHPRLRQFRADLLLANLSPPLFRALVGPFTNVVAANGVAVLSGMEEAHAAAVAARYRAAGFMLKGRILLDGWATLILCQRKPKPLGA